MPSQLFNGLGLVGGPVGELTGDPAPANAARIPLPNYQDPASRLKYAQAWLKKYGPYMQGRGDTPLRVNEKPVHSNLTSKELATRIGGKYSIDPALLYASAMEEGMSGIYPGQKYLEYKMSSNKDFPISGQWSFGLDSFLGKYKDMMRRGLLDKDFTKMFSIDTEPMTQNQRANFKNPESALTASAAMWKGHYDDVDDYAKKNNIKLSPQARDFFALIGFNAGEGTARQMITDYNNNNYLKDDAFLKARPKTGKGLKENSYAETYDNVIRRIKMANALKQEGLFEDMMAKMQAQKKPLNGGMFPMAAPIQLASLPQ